MAATEGKKKQNKIASTFSRVGKFFHDVKAEIKKITWPAIPVVFKNMGITLVMIVVVGLFVFALDFGFNKLLGLIMEVAPITK